MTTNLDYKLLIFITVIGLITLFITDLPISIFSKLSAVEEYNNIHSEYENMYQNLNMESTFEKNQNILMKKINELNIETEILQDEIIKVLSHISKKNNIELDNIKFSEIMTVFSDDFKSEELESHEGQDYAAICMKVSVDFNCDFNDMLSFVDDIKDIEMEIAVLDISILLIDNGNVHVISNFMFYALPLHYGR